MKLIIIALTGFLVGCGTAPVFLGDSTDGDAFFARLTQFRAETALPGILRAIGTNRGVEASGCQLSMRGDVPRGTVATLYAGECSADLGQEPTDMPSDGIWTPDL